MMNKNELLLIFWNDYSLDVNYEDKRKKKTIVINTKDKKQLFDIIKKRNQYKFWQPERRDKRKLVRALEDLNG